ncbi:MAG TPA: hypothetical protein VMK16_05230 [Acidimicrobiales bacterium]|nr:hypothetical protein [Acidimicrobiales bacterium]
MFVGETVVLAVLASQGSPVAPGRHSQTVVLAGAVVLSDAVVVGELGALVAPDPEQAAKASAPTATVTIGRRSRRSGATRRPYLRVDST